MLDFTAAQLEGLAVHYIGNKNEGEDLQCSHKVLEVDDPLMRQLLHTYFLSSFKGERLYHFYHETDLSLNEVCRYTEYVFDDPGNLHFQSVNIAKHLYEQSNHPWIKSGEFYVALFSNCEIDGRSVDAVGLFKSERKDTFLKVYPDGDNFGMDHEEGINIKKLDKGCLIFNTDAEEGYRVCTVDALSQQQEARYWKDDFLRLKPVENNFYQTQSLMDLCRDFCKDVLTEENGVSRVDQIAVMNKSADYLKEEEVFDPKGFEEKVLEAPEAITAFNDYRRMYEEERGEISYDNFEISNQAVKNNRKFMKHVIKLDKNFHVYVHGNPNNIERGYDEARQQHYYQLFFDQES